MARQPAFQEVAQLAGAGAAAGLGNDMSNQPDIAIAVMARLDDAGPHVRMIGERGLDLLQLNAVAADLDLMVGAPEAFDGAIGAAAGEVTGAIQPRACLARERIWDEALPALRGIVDIAAPDTGTADAELADHAGRLRLQIGIEHVKLGIGQRSA